MPAITNDSAGNFFAASADPTDFYSQSAFFGTGNQSGAGSTGALKTMLDSALGSDTRSALGQSGGYTAAGTAALSWRPGSGESLSGTIAAISSGAVGASARGKIQLFGSGGNRVHHIRSGASHVVANNMGASEGINLAEWRATANATELEIFGFTDPNNYVLWIQGAVPVVTRSTLVFPQNVVSIAIARSAGVLTTSLFRAANADATTVQLLLASGRANNAIVCSHGGVCAEINMGTLFLFDSDGQLNNPVGKLSNTVLIKGTTYPVGTMLYVSNKDATCTTLNTPVNGTSDRRYFMVGGEYGADQIAIRVGNPPS